jgi:hypothetical protein
MVTRIAFTACLLLAVFPIASHGETWNLADDFSAAQNPNGAWSFGWRDTPAQPLTLYVDNSTHYCDLESWMYFIAYFCPQVQRNPHDYPVSCTTFVLPPHKVMFHPGPAQQSVVRWTAPSDQDVPLTVNFVAIDKGSEIVHVYHNGTQLFSATLDHLGQTADYATTITVQAGDVIDCAISPISFYYDSTQLDIELGIPDPPVGACCFASGDCLLGTEASCEGAGGTYMGDGVTCDTDPCDATPVQSPTWGEVKSRFR